MHDSRTKTLTTLPLLRLKIEACCETISVSN